MNLSDYDYDLPDDRIALYPSPRRDESRLMVLEREGRRIHHVQFKELPQFLNPEDCLVLNETRVVPARLIGCRQDSGGRVELLLLRREGDLWETLAKPGRRLRPGVKVVFPDEDLVGIVECVNEDGRRLIRFEGGSAVEEVLERRGHMPLPPYILREDDPSDRERYQTIYAKSLGAVAAPTAGLHFTEEVFDAIEDRRVKTARLVLHVGPGTFQPVTVEDPDRHEMEAEYYEISPECAEAVNGSKSLGGRVVAVGTTSVRSLESSAKDDDGGSHLKPSSGWTRLFIRPPYEFRMTDALITNFHLPSSTLLMLVSAFTGKEFVLEAYREAIREGYRFYSYGDAMLIL